MGMAARIELGDSTVDMVVKLSEGVPGALVVLKQILERGEEIDPDSFAGPFSGLLSLDSLSIYGSGIWRLYKDVCGEDVVKTLAVLRAQQLGSIRRGDIHAAVEGGNLDVDGLVVQVQERLPGFAAGYRPVPRM
jgi:hypothetical protein